MRKPTNRSEPRRRSPVRQGWDGDPIPTLTIGGGQQGRVVFDLDAATLQPEPSRALLDLRDAFAHRGMNAGDTKLPRYQNRDVVSLANYVTMALRHDLPTKDRRDTLVIWDKWRRFVLRAREELIGSVSTQPYPEPYDVAYSLRALDEDLRAADKAPGEVAQHYCPWAADFFALNRLRPEDFD